MTTATPATQAPKAPAPGPGRTEFVDEMSDAAAGIGLWTVTLFGIVPGFLPTVALTIVAVAIFVIPVVALGAVVGLPLLALRLASRLVAAARHDGEAAGARRDRMVRTEPAPALH